MTDAVFFQWRATDPRKADHVKLRENDVEESVIPAHKYEVPGLRMGRLTKQEASWNGREKRHDDRWTCANVCLDWARGSEWM